MSRRAGFVSSKRVKNLSEGDIYMHVCDSSSLGENADMAECLRRRVKAAVLWAGFEYPGDSKSSSMAQLVFRTQRGIHTKRA